MRLSNRRKSNKIRRRRRIHGLKQGKPKPPKLQETIVWGRPVIAVIASVVAVLCLVFLWSYWPTVVYLVSKWKKEPDYSHGFLVLPLAIYVLWARRQIFPKAIGTWRWVGAALILMSVAMRCTAGLFFVSAFDGWSMVIWIAGAICLLGGWPVLKWALPAVLFLCFAIPLPFRAERMLSLPLQQIAANTSTWMLQCCGQPALNEGTTILLGDHRLEVEQACSGLRIFVGILALAFAFVILTKSSVWEKVLLLLSAIPIALLANAIRIVGTAFLLQLASSETATKIAHDAAGWVMIPLAAAMFAMVVWYFRFLVPEVSIANVQSLISETAGLGDRERETEQSKLRLWTGRVWQAVYQKPWSTAKRLIFR